MARCARRLGGLAALALVLAGGGACSEILGVEVIPNNPPDAGVDSTADARRDAGADAVRDMGAGCGKVGATRCAPSGVAVELCGSDGGWSPSSACPEDTPVCVGTRCTCLPGDTRCSGPQPQVCSPPDGGAPTWQSIGGPCSGACALSGCLPSPPSCADAVDGGAGLSDCPTGEADAGDGGSKTESCCTSNEVPGGTFYISYDGFSQNYRSKEAEATVSGFRLDRFEVTVGRFRSFVKVLGAGGTGDGGAGWVPPAHSGKHVHLNAGAGLVNREVDGGAVFEEGWDTAWDSQLTAASVTGQLSCGSSPYATWTAGDDRLPVNCISWAAAYAFCIWDGGFLPSDIEWNYAAAGGADQRIYPWSPPFAEQSADGGAEIDCPHANYVNAMQCNPGPNDVGSESQTGDSKWRQADMAGNVFEWTLDTTPPNYTRPWKCRDCALLPTLLSGPNPYRLQRGGAFLSPSYILYTSFVGQNAQNQGSYAAGLRCARAP